MPERRKITRKKASEIAVEVEHHKCFFLKKFASETSFFYQTQWLHPTLVARVKIHKSLKLCLGYLAGLGFKKSLKVLNDAVTKGLEKCLRTKIVCKVCHEIKSRKKFNIQQRHQAISR